MQRSRVGVLDGVRQRLLRDPIEHRLDLARQVETLALYGDRERRAVGHAQPFREALERRSETDVIEHRRTQLDGQAANALEGVQDELANGRHRLLPRARLEPAQGEQDRGERLPGLVMQLARQARSLALLARDDRAHRLAPDPAREIDRGRRAVGERLGQPEVIVAEARVTTAPRGVVVIAAEQADRLAVDDQRDEDAARGPDRARVRLVDRDVVHQRVDALGAAALDHPAEPERQRHAALASVLRALAEGRGDAKAGALDQLDRDEPRVHHLREATNDQLQQAVEILLGEQRRLDLVERLDLGGPARRCGQQPGVLDRARDLRGEQRDDRLILLRERLPVVTIAQVEISVDDATQKDRNAEERLHRRVPGRKADRAGIILHPRKTDRPGGLDQRAEQATTSRQLADRGGRGLIEPGGDESLERHPLLIEHAERAIARTRDARCRVDRDAQHGVEIDL